MPSWSYDAANYMDAAFAPIMLKYHCEILEATWGHLAPKKNRTYRGHIEFAFGSFGNDSLNACILSAELKTRNGEELSSSPWFYEALQEFCDKWATGYNEGYENAGKVFRFEGTFRNYEFVGQTRQMNLVAGALAEPAKAGAREWPAKK